MEPIFARIVHDEITEVYDVLDALLNRISVERSPELTRELTTARDACFRARLLTDGKMA